MEEVKYIYLSASEDNQIDRAFIEYKDGSIESIMRGTTDYETFGKEMSRRISKAFGENAAKLKNKKWGVYENGSKRINKIQKKYYGLVDIEEIKNDNVTDVKATTKMEELNNKKVKLQSALIGLGAFTVVSGIAGCGIMKANEKNNTPATTITTEADDSLQAVIEDDTLDLTLEGKDWAYYDENFPEGVQKYSKTSVYDYAMKMNASENWMNIKLTPEMIQALEDLEIKFDSEDKTEAIFGFTAEELDAANIFAGNHENEGLAQILHGEKADIAAIKEEYNNFKRKAIYWYLNTDNEHLNIDEVVNLNDNQVATINKFESMLFEIKNLVKEEKIDEANEKMRVLKQELLDYAHSENSGTMGEKEFIISTIASAASVISQSYNMQSEIEIELLDTTTNTIVTKKVKTNTMNEVTMRYLIEGFSDCHGINDFNNIEYLAQFRMNGARYVAVLDDDGVSVVDVTNTILAERLEGYNEWVEGLIMDNAARDGAYTADSLMAMNDNSELDKLIYGGYDNQAILDLINAELVKANKYPKNNNVFASEYSKFVKQIVEYKNKHAIGGSGITNNTNVKSGSTKMTYIPGQTITRIVDQHTDYSYRTEVKDNENFEAEEKAARESAEKSASEKSKKAQKAHDDAVEKLKKGEKVDTTGMTDEEKKAVEEAEKAVDDYKKKKEEVEKKHEGEKPSKEYVDKDGNTHIVYDGKEEKDEEFENADTVDKDEAEEYNRKLQEKHQQEQSQAQEGLTDVDPTTLPGFAPVVESSTDSTMSVSSETLDAIIEAMEEAPAEEVSSNGMSI